MIAEIVINRDGTVRFYNEKNEYHRLDGPALEYATGNKIWWANGKFHRIDGPAVEYVNGRKEWWIKDELHRLDGPAVEYEDGSKGWFINGTVYSEEAFNKIVGKLC